MNKNFVRQMIDLRFGRVLLMPQRLAMVTLIPQVYLCFHRLNFKKSPLVRK